MGIDRMTYCGPFVECKVTKKKTTFTQDTCTNPKCSQHNKPVPSHEDRFCNRCGRAIETIKVPTEVDTVDAWELEEEYAGKIWQPFGELQVQLGMEDTHIWLIDTDDCPGAVFIDENYESLTSLTPEDIQKSVAEFTHGARKELKLLRRRYGSTCVDVKWGVIHSVRC